MPDLKLTIGADTTELQSDLKNSGRTVQKEIEDLTKGGPNSNLKEALIRQGGIPSLFVFLDSLANVIQRIGSAISSIMAEARDYRNIANVTGLKGPEISQLKNIADATGVNLHSMSNAYVEFNKRLGEARIKGSEVNNLFAKLGIGMKDVAEGNFQFIDALNMLADAHMAGTDNATLDYYANMLLGSSYKELIPVIMAGRDAIDRYKNSFIEANIESSKYAAALGDDTNKIWNGFKNMSVKIVSGFAEIGYNIQNGLNTILTTIFGGQNGEELAKHVMDGWNSAMTKEQKLESAKIIDWMRVDTWKSHPEERDKFWNTIDKALGAEGKKLSPFGLSEAGAASQMQQMGGGDIFGAVAFSPLDAIKDNTKEIAENTRPKPEAAAPVTQTPLLK